ncbi:MAG TPA: histidine phosphatase family protein [Xanthobacteraceae bacterium]|nr:histidine phosphatase family protein [Xanthobacteraceae bacterium]
MTKILLTRHGHVEGIKPARFRGREPLDLTARGRAEAEAVARRIAGAWRPSAIYTSPMGRCVATAAAIAKACGIAAKTCDDLNDIDYGAWQFKTFVDAKAQDPELFATWFATPQLVRFPNGEALQDLAARVADAVRMVLSRHAGDTIVLVGHDSVNRMLLLHFLDLPPSAFWRIDQTPCCLDEIDVTGDKVCVRRINETRHLDAIAPSDAQ